MDHSKKLSACDDDDSTSVGTSLRDDETQGPPGTDVSLERLDQQHQGAYYSTTCPICSTYLGADVALDGFDNLKQFHAKYYTIRNVVSPRELYRELAENYNKHLAENGEVITEAQVRNHFEANHLHSAELSIEKSIRGLEITETQLSKSLFERVPDGREKFKAEEHAAYLKTISAKAMLWKLQREFKQRV